MMDEHLMDTIWKLFPSRDTWRDSIAAFQRNVYPVDKSLDIHAAVRATYRGGSTALVAFYHFATSQLTVASLGDSQAFLKTGTQKHFEQVNEEHNGRNALEVERIEREHPGEEGLVQCGRTLGFLTITRFYPIPSDYFKTWPVKHSTPPYISIVPSFSHHHFLPGDILLLVSDGLSDSPQLKKLDREQKATLFTSLVLQEEVGESEKTLDHSLLSKEEEPNDA
ncbi:hypothetical protein T439DRAFT_32161 [Meredithblackwellia eburnea MCA 4105]